MEADRFKQSHTLFIICMVCLLLSLSLFSFALFILPFLIWGWHYQVPEFVFTLAQWLIDTYNYTQVGAKVGVFLILFIPALVTGLISYITSNFIEKKVLDISPPPPPEGEQPPTREIKETLGLTAKILLLLAVVVVVVLLGQWLISGTEVQE